MYNNGCNDDLYKDRSRSFRKAVCAPRKNQGYTLTYTSDLSFNLEDTSRNRAVNIKPDIEFSHKAAEKTKYNWKRFLPWAPRTTG